MKKNIGISIFVLFIAIGALHAFSIHFYFYWIFWWLDIPMHFLGGLFAGLVGLWTYLYSGVFSYDKQGRFRLVFAAVIGALVIGGFWEVYEYFTGQTYNAIRNYPLDVLKDMVFDVLGGFVAAFYVEKGLKKETRGPINSWQNQSQSTTEDKPLK
ncbi:MAG: hypothetical protein Q8P86_00620 [bacterium]|nr:hypothetical protein [bacterium]